MKDFEISKHFLIVNKSITNKLSCSILYTVVIFLMYCIFIYNQCFCISWADCSREEMQLISMIANVYPAVANTEEHNAGQKVTVSDCFLHDCLQSATMSRALNWSTYQIILFLYSEPLLNIVYIYLFKFNC